MVALVRPDGDVAATSPLWKSWLGAAAGDPHITLAPLLDALRAGRSEGTVTTGEQPLRWSSHPLSDHEPASGWVVMLDVLPTTRESSVSESRFQDIFNTMFEFTALISIDGTLLEANEAALRLGGLTREAVVGRKVWATDWFEPSEAAQIREDVSRAAGGAFVRHEIHIRGTNETPTPIDFSIIPVRDAQGQVIHLIAEGRDISDLYRARTRLEETQRMLLHAQRMAGLGSWQWNARTNHIEWSDEVYRIFNLPVGAEVSFETYIARLHPDDRDALQACVRRAVEEQQGYTVEHRVVWPDGHMRYVHSVAEVTHDDGGHLVLIGTVQDLTERMQSEEALRKSEEQFRLLADNASDMVCLRALDGTYLYVSPSVKRIVGYEPEELIGTDPAALMHPDDAARVESEVAQALVEGEAARTLARMRRKDGSYIWIETTSRPYVSEHGRVIRSSSRDVTERVQAEQALAHTLQTLEQRNRELQDFAYVASHDLQEPLRKIRAFAGLLLQEHADQLDESGRHYLGRIDDAAGRMASLITALLTFSRVATRAQPFQKVNLADIARDVIGDLEIALQESNGEVDVDALPTLEADPVQMRQLFQNLIGNALKFAEPGRAPHVQVRAKVRTASKSKVVVLEVSDNGIGFDEKYLDRIFTPFQRLHHRMDYPGTGMGLAICRRIVERHGGQITARSTPGEGTTFVVTLPCTPAPPPSVVHHHDA